jgi:hypothetical protein
MPVKRRTPKRKITYPDAVERLIADKRIQDTDENRDALIGLAFFHDFPELAHLQRDAIEVLAQWPALSPSERQSCR